jgi:hypothetical protein
MVSLTPESRSDEIIGAAMNEGYFNGVMVLLPSFAGMYAAMQNPKFVKVRTKCCNEIPYYESRGLIKLCFLNRTLMNFFLDSL